LAGNVLLPEEVGGGVLSGHQIERNETGPTFEPRAGLVEADVAGASDAEELKVDAPGVGDGGLVPAAVLDHLVPGNVASGEVHLPGRDVEKGEEVLPHEPMVGVEAPGVHRVVLVEVEGHHPGEGKAFLPMHPDQLAVDADRR